MIPIAYALIICCALICWTAIDLRERAYKFRKSAREHVDNLALTGLLEAKLAKLDEIEAKVNGLQIMGMNRR